MHRVLPLRHGLSKPKAASFRSVPEQAAPRRTADRRPTVLCEAQQQSTTMVDAMTESPPALSLVRQPTVLVNKAFTTDVRGARRDLHISNAEPDMRHIVVHEDPVGEGGQSVVFAATNAATGASLVYKQLRATDMQEALAEALHEANIASDMGSPMAPMVVQQSDTVGLLARAMPADLLQSVRGIEKASWPKIRTLALDALFDVASDLHALHSKGYLHCDIKADNVLAADDNAWKLGDFGHAARTQDFHALKRTRGTMAFWAPEVFDGAPFSQKSDIFSLGLLYLTVLGRGTPPMFTADPLDHYIDAGNWEAFIDHGHQDLDNSAWIQDRPAFAQIYTHLNADEKALVRALLHPDPQERPSAESLLALREDIPGLKRRSRIRRKALDVLPQTGALRIKHEQRMREVLQPRELERLSSYTSSESDSEVSTPRTPRQVETTPTHRRR